MTLLMMNGLLIFQFISVILLKIVIISTQCTMDAALFNIYNACICLIKVLLMPNFRNLSIKRQSEAIMVVLILSLYSYIAAILCMIMLNSFVINILNRFDNMRNHSTFSLVSKIGTLVGTFIVPFFTLFITHCKNSVGLSFALICIYSSVVYCLKRLTISEKIQSIDIEDILNEDGETKNSFQVIKNVKNTLLDLPKYWKVIILYFFLAAAGFVCSNAPFLTGSHTKAYVPCLALLAISVRNRKIQIMLSVIFASISYHYFDSLGLLLYSMLVNCFGLMVKMWARRKYNDAYSPHTTAHLYNDFTFFVMHSILGVYYFFVS